MFKVYTHTHVIVALLCPTLCDPVDSSPPGSSVHGILQAIILEWVAISFSRDTHTHTHTHVSNNEEYSIEKRH